MRSGTVTFGQIAAVLIVLFWGNQAQATVFFDDSFEGATAEASGWDYASGACRNPGGAMTHPCPYLELSTDIAYAGSKSLKGVYNAAWSDPNPQINTQAIFRFFPATTDLYLRYYYRTNAFTYGVAGTKHIYYKSSANTLPNGFSINWFGSRELGFASQGSGGLCPNGKVDSCNYLPNMATRPLADNVWYCVEEHWKLGTPGNSDGMIELWIDGVQTVGYYNQRFLGTVAQGPGFISSTTNFDFLEIYKQNGDGMMYYDQVAAGNTRIGCTGGSTQDTTPPASPIGLSIR